MIVQTKDLFTYSIALKNSGISPENIDMLERQIIVYLFGKDDAKKIISYINQNTKETTLGSPKFGGNAFGCRPEQSEIKYTYGDITELINGDQVLFSGLKALLSVLICTNLLSQNRIQVARQNVTKEPISSKATTKREESDVVQSLAYTAHNIIYAMIDYLKQPNKNPLEIKVVHNILPVRYSTNTSGKMPSHNMFMGFLG